MNQTDIEQLEKIGYFLIPDSNPPRFSGGGQFSGGVWEVDEDEALKILEQSNNIKKLMGKKEAFVVVDDTLNNFVPLLIVVENKEIIRINKDGNIYWNGREVETDEDFRSCLLDMVPLLIGNKKL